MNELKFKIGPQEAQSFVSGALAGAGDLARMLLAIPLAYGFVELMMIVTPLIRPGSKFLPKEQIRIGLALVLCTLALLIFVLYFLKTVPRLAFQCFRFADSGIKIFSSSNERVLIEIPYSGIGRILVGRNISTLLGVCRTYPFCISITYKKSPTDSMEIQQSLGMKTKEQIDLIVSQIQRHNIGVPVITHNWHKL